jgi:branched-chain amino acid transport system ATP-binding protein
VDGLTVSYGRQVALSPISFEVEEGAFILVLGPNGAGKSSLVRALAGAVRPRSGRVRLAEGDVTYLPAYRRVRRGIALVPEGRGTLRGLSVAENLALGWESSSKAQRRSGDRSRAIGDVLELFPRLQERLQQDCATLSGGEMQMLAIARGLLAKPRLLLLDEPSLGLAPLIIAALCSTLMQLNEQGLTMIMVEQKAVPLDRAPSLTMVLHSGRVVYEAKDRRPTKQELASLYLGESTA